MTPPKGVKGQNVSYFHNFQNATPPTDYVAWSCNLVKMTRGLVATKNYQRFDLKGHVEVKGIKKVNHVKNIKTALI